MPERAKKTSKRSPTEAFAASIGLVPVPADLRFTVSFRAPAQGQYQPPHYELVIDASTRLLLGATFVGPEAGELVHAATVAIVGDVPVHVLRHAVASYPTASELWLRLLEELPREFRQPRSRR